MICGTLCPLFSVRDWGRAVCEQGWEFLLLLAVIEFLALAPDSRRESAADALANVDGREASGEESRV